MQTLFAPFRRGLVLAAALLAASAFAAPPVAAAADPSAIVRTAAGKKDSTTKAQASAKKAKAAKSAKPGKKTAKKDPEAGKPGPLADFGDADAPSDVVQVANWVSSTRNHGKKAFVLIDKKNAQLYVFDPRGKLKDHTPVLLGKAVGDDSAPGIGSKPLSQIKEEEKTTPAGRFLAATGKNNHGEDIIWIDYKAAVSMHRLRKVSAEERRAERMETPESDDNRISNGCVNVPPGFYNGVLRPSVRKYGAYIYVLPETRTPEQTFGSLAVPSNQNKA